MRGKLTILLVACALLPKTATAQYNNERRCEALLEGSIRATEEPDYKTLVAIERQYLTFCQADIRRMNDYAMHLGTLAGALNGDNQPQEALGVANSCLRTNDNDLRCLAEKTDALYHLGRVAEAKSVVEMSLSIGAITELDVAVKRKLQLLNQTMALNQSMAAVPNAKASSSRPNQTPSARAQVALKKNGGTFVVPVQINGAITLDFAVDSGASDVSVPADVFSTLRRTGTIRDEDISSDQTYVLADGTKRKSATFTIRSLRVGNKVVENVRGSVTSAQGTLLLGQSFLERFKSWSIDNAKHQLVLDQ
jgi:clan AA aspartic protease (TIGR02281 family)